MLDLNQKLHVLDSSTPLQGNLNLDMEAEYITLPSRGIFYKGKYKNVDKLKIKKLGWAEEDMLTTQSYYVNDMLFFEVLKSSIVDKNFPVGELIEIDKNAILWWLRIGAFGREYVIPHICSGEKCKKKYDIVWDLGSFQMPDYSLTYEKELLDNNYITVSLPNNKIKFCLAPCSFNKSFEVNSLLNSLKNKDGKTYNITKKLINSIKLIIDEEGKEYSSTAEIYKWLTTNKISLPDSRFLQKCIKEIELEIDTELIAECKHCGHTEPPMSLPMGNHFFGLNTAQYREYLIKSINFLTFWGKLDYQSVLAMSTAKRRSWIDMTHDNLAILFPKSKK